AVTLVRSYKAFQSGDLDQADAQVGKLLADTPNDPNAKVLKAHILIARDRIDDAIALLEAQHRTVPDDRSALRGLAALYRSRDDWRNLARVEFDLHRLAPNDPTLSQSLVEALLRAGDVADARRISGPLVAPTTDARVVDATLISWASYAPGGRSMADALVLAQGSAGDRRVAFANYFNRIAKPAA